MKKFLILSLVTLCFSSTSWAQTKINPNQIGPGTISSDITFKGQFICKNFENVRCVDSTNSAGWSGADFGAWLNSAYADGPSSGVHIRIAPGSYTFTTPVVFGTASKPVFLDCTPGYSSGNPTTNAITFLQYTPTTGTALTVNTGAGSRVKGCGIAGSGIGNSTVGVLAGGTNGFQIGGMGDMDISGFGVGLKFGSNAYILTFDNMYIHDNGTSGLDNILIPSGLSIFGENISFNGGAIANKPNAFSTSCVDIQSGADITFKNVSFDQCGVTINAVNILIRFDSAHFENPNGSTASPFITIGTAGNNYSVILNGGTMLEDFSSARTAFVDDTSTVVNHGGYVVVYGLGVQAQETVTQFMNNSGGQCCPRFFASGVFNAYEGGLKFTNYLGGSGWNGAIIADSDAGSVSFGTPTKLGTIKNSNTAARNYTFPDADIAKVADTGTLTLKKGSGGGNYTNATTSYTVADATNLCYTVTIPTGWKLGISASGSLGTSTAIVNAFAALTDNAACSTANAGILAETQVDAGTIAGFDSFALNWVITGDGNAHNIALQFKTSNVADTANLLNSSATLTPTMKFELMPSN